MFLLAVVHFLLLFQNIGDKQLIGGEEFRTSQNRGSFSSWLLILVAWEPWLHRDCFQECGKGLLMPVVLRSKGRETEKGWGSNITFKYLSSVTSLLLAVSYCLPKVVIIFHWHRGLDFRLPAHGHWEARKQTMSWKGE